MNIGILWSYLYSWIHVIVAVAVVTVLAALIVPRIIKKFDYSSGNGLVMYLLYNKSRREILYMSTVLIEAIFVIACIASQKEMDMDSLFILGLLSVVIMITGKRPKLIIIEILNCAVVAVGMLCSNIMWQYLSNVKVEITVLILFIALNILIIGYMVFFVVWHIVQLKRRYVSDYEDADEDVMDGTFTDYEEETDGKQDDTSA